MSISKNMSKLKKAVLTIVGLLIVLFVVMMIVGSLGQVSDQPKTSDKKDGPGAADVTLQAPAEIPPAPEAKEVVRVFEVISPIENGYLVKDSSTGIELSLFIASDTNVEYRDGLNAVRPGHFLRLTRYREGMNGIVVLDMSVNKELVSPTGGVIPPAPSQE